MKEVGWFLGYVLGYGGLVGGLMVVLLTLFSPGSLYVWWSPTILAGGYGAYEYFKSRKARRVKVS